ncbi:MAG: ATPase, T2SS/T4P/T4SS family [Romboutsia sp.]
MIKIIAQENSLARLISMKLSKKYNRFLIKDNDNNKSNETYYINVDSIESLNSKSNISTVFNKENNIPKTPQFNYNIENKLGEGYGREIFQEILRKAILKNASDIHIEPFEKDIVIRLRIDGQLQVIDKYPMNIYSYLSSVIKLDMSMNITEKRIPQDGRRDITIIM